MAFKKYRINAEIKNQYDIKYSRSLKNVAAFVSIIS